MISPLTLFRMADGTCRDLILKQVICVEFEILAIFSGFSTLLWRGCVSQIVDYCRKSLSMFK